MTVKEITNKIKHILEELSYPSAVAYLTLNDKKWLKATIKALEQEPVLDKIRAEIQGIEINGQIDEHALFIRSGNEVKNIALDIINKYTAESEE